MEIVCVSLEIKIKDDWVTILRYNSHHDGILHRPTIIAYNNTADIVDYNGTKRNELPDHKCYRTLKNR